MPTISSTINTASESFKENLEFHNLQLNVASAIASEIYNGGGDKARQLHESRGKIFVRDRINLLLDFDADFLEIGLFAANKVYDFSSNSAGIVCGIGKIHSINCMIIANDATVKGGTYNPLTVKKHLRAQQIALENLLPCVYLVDSGGAFLPMQDEVFPDKDHFGRIFFNQAQMSAARIPQIAVVMGSCTAGGAYIPAMSEETIIVKNTGTIFLGGPPLVKAATGEEVTAQELGGAEVHTEKSGVADHFAENDEHAIELTRNIIKNLQIEPTRYLIKKDYAEPICSPEEISGVIEKDSRIAYDPRQILARIVDASNFDEFKSRYATTIITGFASIHGYKIGIIANNGVLFSESALKATHFIELCCQRKIPLLFLQNITGFMVGKKYETGGIARDGAKLVHAVANANVPKITIVTGGSYGAGNYGMCGRAFSPRFLWMWPNAKISVMGAEQAASVLATVKKDQMARKGLVFNQKEIEEFKKPVLDEYNTKSDVFYSSARLWDDGIIQQKDTRKVIGNCLEICSRAPIGEFKAGVWRM